MKIKTTAVALHGVPGAGKGTLAAHLTNVVPALRLVSCGDLIRDEIKRRTRLGIEFKTFLDNGALVPDTLASEMFINTLDALTRKNQGTHFLLDGFPRTSFQAIHLHNYAKSHDWAHLSVITLRVPSDVAKTRLSTRRTCSICGAIYNLNSRCPANPGRCDHDGTELFSRPDEEADLLSIRFAAYVAAYNLLDKHFHEAGWRICEIDASAPIEQVAASGLRAYETLNDPINILAK